MKYQKPKLHDGLRLLLNIDVWKV